MLTLQKGQRLVLIPELCVLEGGDYKETDRVPVARIGEEVLYSTYQANTIVNGVELEVVEEVAEIKTEEVKVDKSLLDKILGK